MTNAEKIAFAWLNVFQPPERLKPSEWADKYRYLSPESSGAHGKYNSDLTPYAREWMDSVVDPKATGTVLMVGSQLSKTETQNNLIGYFIDIDPATILMVQPTVELAESWSKERFTPMVRDTPRLKAKVSDSKSRDASNTITFKRFKGGNLAMAGANAPSGLASRPRRVVMADEVDRFPISAGKEGDPISLAVRRTESFWNAVVFITSTPTIKNHSRVESEFLESDQRYYYCPCPRCNHKQTLKWVNVQWEAEDGSDAYLLCESCKAHLTDEERIDMVKNGEWVPTYPDRKLRGYHLPGIASLFQHKKGYVSRLHQMAADNIRAKKGGKETLKTWVNTFLAETWEDEGESLSWEPLYARREDWGEFPENAYLLTAGVDVQGDRFEVEVVGWGEGDESWSIDHFSVMGDFNNVDAQRALDNILSKKYKHPSGIEVPISCVFIDSGHKTDSVYSYTKPRQIKKVFACKGVGGPGIPLVGRPTKPGQNRAMLFKVGTDTGKELVYSRIDSGEKQNGFMHFPHDRPEDWFKQLVSETKVTRYKNGIPYIKFENPSRSRNEALDIRVYATAAYALLRVDWQRVKASFEKTEPKEEKKIVRKPRQRQRSNWVNSW